MLLRLIWYNIFVIWIKIKYFIKEIVIFLQKSAIFNFNGPANIEFFSKIVFFFFLTSHIKILIKIWCSLRFKENYLKTAIYSLPLVLNSFSIVNNSPNYFVTLYSITKNSFTWHHCFIGGPCFFNCMTGISWNQFTWGTDSHQNLLIYYSINLTIFTSYECIH